MNTAISFSTNTNWQSYTPESTMSYLTQMLGLATHNFWSAAVGMAMAIAFIRGIAGREKKTLGNFWVDMTRSTLWILLPIASIFALTLVSQGVIQNLRPYDTATLVQPQTSTTTGTDGKPVTTTVTTQSIAQGPVASQEAIKMLGTNGGGFFNANSAHPFENPTPLTNFLQMLSIFLIPAGLRSRSARWSATEARLGSCFAAMTVLWFGGVLTCFWAESQPNPLLHNVDQPSRLDSVRRQYGGQGGSLRHRQLRTLRHRHHGRQLRRSQLHARLASRRSAAWCRMVNIHARRDRLRRRGRGLYGMLVFVVVCRSSSPASWSVERRSTWARRSRPTTCRWRCSIADLPASSSSASPRSLC